MIRRAEMTDLPAIAALERRAFTDPWNADTLGRAIRGRLETFLVDERDGRIAGYVLMMRILEDAEIENLCTDPAYRRQGIAEGLMQAVMSTGISEGAEVFRLEVRESNVPAIRLYEKMGFVPYGRRPDYYTDPMEDALLYLCQTEDPDDA